ncbi:MAG: RsiW-degrading membrane proteinase PrsW (M82 family) [Saprospiraceae bacterium]|jgi:RsiW-degrading membrane proteinase PrsW (M82 family)
MILSKSQSFVLKVILPVFAVAIIGVNLLASRFSLEETLQNKIDAALFVKNDRELCLLLIQKIDSLKHNYDLHDYAVLVRSYTDLDDYDKSIVDHFFKKKQTGLKLIFDKLLLENPRREELGLMSKAVYRYDKSLSYKPFIDSVHSVFRYKNLLNSYWFQEEEILDSAIFYLETEYQLYPCKENYFMLFRLYESNDEVEKLTEFINLEGKAKYIGTSERLFFLKHKEYIFYLKTVVKPIYSGSNFLLILVSFIVVLVWVMYLKGLKFFAKIKWKYLVLTFLLSLLFSEITLVLYDLWSWLGIDESGDFINDLMYYVIGVGLIEETVKLTPVLLVMLFLKKAIKEPIDYIILASVSALGFAFGENILYYNHNFESIDSRAMSSTLIHMALTSIAVYGYVIHVLRKKSFFYFLFTFAIAVVIHGLYDVFLGENMSMMCLISLTLLLLGAVAWVKITNNVINFSPYFSRKNIPSYSKITILLTAGLAGVVLVEYLYSVHTYGLSIANSHTLTSSFITAIMLAVVVLKVSKIAPVKEEWKPIELFNLTRFFNFEDYTDSKVKVLFRSGPLKGRGVKGIVVSKLNFTSENNYLVVGLVSPIEMNGMILSRILLRPSRQGTTIFDPNVTVVVRLINPGQNIEEENLKVSDFSSLGTGVLNEVLDFDH